VAFCPDTQSSSLVLLFELAAGTRAILITKTKTRTKVIAIRLLKLELELKYLEKTKTI